MVRIGVVAATCNVTVHDFEDNRVFFTKKAKKIMTTLLVAFTSHGCQLALPRISTSALIKAQ